MRRIIVKGRKKMREIKFRAWDERKKRMHYSNLHKTVWVGGKEASVNTDEGQLAGDFILMQFTGLKDKNGIEIYEGDIVHYELFGGLEAIYEIYWSVICCSFCYKPTSPYSNTILNKDKALNFEVIGNIHENPELLKDKK